MSKRDTPKPERPGYMLLEGKHAVLEALRVRMPLTEIFFAQTERSAASRAADQTLSEIEAYAQRGRIPITRTARRTLDEMSERGAHQGVIAAAAPFRYTPLSQVVREAKNRDNALIIVLDHVTDPGNLGAIARTAAVTGALGLVVARNRAAAITPAAHKAAAGALALVPVSQENNITRALEFLKKEGFWVVGASEKAEQVAWDAPLTGKIALTVGAEGAGLSRLVTETCDFLVKLPQTGPIDSLNVAQATTALAYEHLRQTR
ncbi:MAG: 23S rRNA (guanosine(2251)-2'-O)-methyltransferase RlmB [Coriobacteriia bacterium]|nr:23S rRNA (guanosine(2251)-2'-O)-methyltransferase RlmB [Coriobacteriia bacterium]